MAVGVPLGLIAGYRRGVTDEAVMRVLDVMMAFPPIMLVLLILAVTPPSLMKTAIAIGVLAVAPIARVTRSVALTVRFNLSIPYADLPAAAAAYQVRSRPQTRRGVALLPPLCAGRRRPAFCC